VQARRGVGVRKKRLRVIAGSYHSREKRMDLESREKGKGGVVGGDFTGKKTEGAERMQRIRAEINREEGHHNWF